MRTQTGSKIIEYIEKNGQVQAHELHETFKISRVAVHKQLNKLLFDGKIERKGRPPIVFYTIKQQTTQENEQGLQNVLPEVKKLIDENFLSITPSGEILYGAEGFLYWFSKFQSKKDISQIADEYCASIIQQNKFKNSNGMIEATMKLRDNFSNTPIQHLFVADVYSLPVFGRTKLAKLVMYAKQVGDRRLVEEVVTAIRPLINKIISSQKIDSVVFVPPTVPRPIQFMDLLEKMLSLDLRKVNVVKVVPGEIPVAQKTLSSLEERIINARDTFFLKDAAMGNNILLIDDVVGSGSSLQDIAVKLKRVNLSVDKTIGFGIVGNLKGYEVIRQI